MGICQKKRYRVSLVNIETSPGSRNSFSANQTNCATFGAVTASPRTPSLGALFFYDQMEIVPHSLISTVTGQQGACNQRGKAQKFLLWGHHS